MVNYRGSTGYGQAFTDAFSETECNEPRMWFYGSALLAALSLLDRGPNGVEGFSYGVSNN